MKITRFLLQIQLVQSRKMYPVDTVVYRDLLQSDKQCKVIAGANAVYITDMISPPTS